MQFVSVCWGDLDESFIRAERSNGDIVTIPVDPANSDYRMITEGCAEEAGSQAMSPMAIAPFQVS